MISYIISPSSHHSIADKKNVYHSTFQADCASHITSHHQKQTKYLSTYLRITHIRIFSSCLPFLVATHFAVITLHTYTTAMRGLNK